METKQEHSRTEAFPATLGLFEKRIDGDDALMELARLRFEQAGMGSEMHAGTPEELEKLMRFQPSSNAPGIVHLPRNFSLLDEWCRQRILQLASQFCGRIAGLVLHDQAELETRTRDFRHAAEELNSGLERLERGPTVYVEYAVGLAPSAFVKLFELIKELPLVSACVDIGHVGIRQARNVYAAAHGGQDVCGLKAHPARLPEAITDIQSSVASALPVVLSLLDSLGAIGKALHFHLHDGHPLSTLSPFGVSDHLSFYQQIALAFEYRGERSVPLLFGPEGLEQIVTHAVRVTGPERVSFTLEIHPANGRLALGDATPLFNHWRDKTNAERMNQWLSVLAQNHALLRNAIQASRTSRL